MNFFAHVHQGCGKQYTQKWPTTDGKSEEQHVLLPWKL